MKRMMRIFTDNETVIISNNQCYPRTIKTFYL